jgi:hypothetical protein
LIGKITAWFGEITLMIWFYTSIFECLSDEILKFFQEMKTLFKQIF